MVSTVPCWGCAEVLSVSMSLCCRASCATFFALIGLMWVRARKSSPCVLKMAQNRRFMACWVNFFAGQVEKACCWANLFAGQVEKACCWANFVAPVSPPLPPSLGPARHFLPAPRPGLAVPPAPSTSATVGVCTTRSFLAACRRRVGASCSAIPLFGGCECMAWRARVRIGGITYAISPM